MTKHTWLRGFAILIIAVCVSSAALRAEDTSDPNKLTRSASVNKPVQPIQYVTPIQVDPLRQYEEAMMPIYNLTIQETTAALKTKPKDAELYARRGGAYASKKDYKNALIDYDSSLKLKPSQTALYPKRAIAHFMLKDYDKSWVNVHESEKRGAELPAAFLDALKKVSGRNK